MVTLEYTYLDQVLGPLNDARSCRSVGSERASLGTGEGASLGKALVSLVDGFKTMGPVKMGGLVGVGDGILHTVQNDPSNSIWKHCWG